MGDFISNRPDGKSDLYTSASQKSEASPPNAPASPPNTLYTDYSDNPAPSFGQASMPPPQPRETPAGFIPQGQSAYSAAVYGPPDESAGDSKKGINIAAMVLGIVTWGGLFLCCGCFSLPTAILAVIFGIVGRRNKKFDGKGLAGFILGISFIVFTVLVLALLIATGWLTSFEAHMEDDIQLMLLRLIG